jgi:branched-chain amino acid transport system permease protein
MKYLPFIVSGIGLGAIYALSSVGLVILYRASGTLNFAFGAFGGVSAFLVWELTQDGVPLLLSSIVGIAVSTGIAYGYGRVFAPRLAHRDRVVRAIATLGLALFLFGGMAWYWGVGVARRLVLAMVVGVGLLLSRTRIGLGMRALASDRHISAAIGVRVTQIDSLAWLVNGMFAGIAGILLANINRLDPGTLTFLVIPAIAAAIMARLSSLPGAFVGGMVAGMIEAVLIATSPEIANLRSAGPYVAALIFLMIVGAGQGVGARE